MPTNPLLTNLALRHQIYLERLKTGHVWTYASVFEKTDAVIKAALNGTDVEQLSELSPAELNALVDKLTQDQVTLFDEANDHWIQQMPDLAVYEAQHEVRGLRAIADAKTKRKLKIPSAKKLAKESLARPIQAFGKRIEDVASDWTKSAVDRTNAAIRNGYVQGKPTNVIIKELLGTKALQYKDGKGAISRRTAATMVRTGTQQIASTARQVTYEENADVILGYEWLSTLDGRTTATCRSLDGRKFKTAEGPLPPIHPNCRSTTTPDLGPEFDFLDEGATRSALGGPVSAEMSYYDWLKTQDEAFQNEVLGPVRGELFRNGGLTTKQFSDLQLNRNFEPITLAEMEELEPAAFVRAGLSDPEFAFEDDRPAATYNRPKPGTTTGAIWDLADELHKELGRIPSRSEILAKGKALGYQDGTLKTQFSRWKQSYGHSKVPIKTPTPDPEPLQKFTAATKAMPDVPLGKPLPVVLTNAQKWEQLVHDMRELEKQYPTTAETVAAHKKLEELAAKYQTKWYMIDIDKLKGLDALDYMEAQAKIRNGSRLSVADSRLAVHARLSKMPTAKKAIKFDTKGYSALYEKNTQEAIAFLEDVTEGQMIKDDVIPFRMSAPGDSSYYHPLDKMIYMAEGRGTRIFAHELGHWIEQDNFASLSRMAKWIETRRAGEKWQHRNHGKNYDYYAYEDEWKERGGTEYTSRLYQQHFDSYVDDAGNTVPKFTRTFTGATEVLSTGIERLFEDPLDFWRRDPDHFQMTIRTLLNLW